MDDADRGDDVYQPQEESQACDPIEQLDTEDILDDPDVDDELDRGYSPPERPYAVDDVGTTAAEQHRGESLESRLARERPENGVPPGDGVGDVVDGDGEPWDREVGTVRAGRLTRDLDIDDPDSTTGEDVGIDGAAASAEEAAVHVIADGRDEA
ncbi:DUF5709 domain-containing protein [Streptomyces sp. NPDC087866]|uniref:DUF5709 domain-containing protein n=1 Tax=unclassified Streptomyces TaxID=2593676 RepID=UPI0011CD3919|nr:MULTISPECIES: DUF5709 domain-containing protein [unclassified Streptomyces]MCX4445986.1 DUF5709 domain-containing protein [Streptomyces sp. NBC_01789]TXS07328.1 hypothetical protein EAO73_01375 [Streptomyces sp. col6]